MTATKTRMINLQLADIIDGSKTVNEILDEGVDSYAIEYYSPRGTVEFSAYQRLYSAWTELQQKPVPVVAAAPVMKKCSCGHVVDAHLVMSTSSGTSCPDCYDRMSE